MLEITSASRDSHKANAEKLKGSDLKDLTTQKQGVDNSLRTKAKSYVSCAVGIIN